MKPSVNKSTHFRVSSGDWGDMSRVFRNLVCVCLRGSFLGSFAWKDGQFVVYGGEDTAHVGQVLIGGSALGLRTTWQSVTMYAF